MKLAEIAQKTDKELAGMVNESRQQLANLVLESRTKETKNVKAILGARKQLARVLTVQRQRQLSQEEVSNG